MSIVVSGSFVRTYGVEVGRGGFSYDESDVRSLVRVLIGIEVVFVILHLLTQLVVRGDGGFVTMFDLDAEVTLPAWFSSVQLFAVGAVLLLAAWGNTRRGEISTGLLLLGGIGFVVLSADEGSRIHERLTTVVDAGGDNPLLFRGGHGGWIAIYGVIGVVVLVVARNGLVQLWRGFRHEAIIGALGAAIYVSGAVVAEIVGYQVRMSRDVRAVLAAVEELGEMAGVTVLLAAVLLLAIHVTGEAGGVPPVALTDDAR